MDVEKVSIPLSDLTEGQQTGFTQYFVCVSSETLFLIVHLLNDFNKFTVPPFFSEDRPVFQPQWRGFWRLFFGNRLFLMEMIKNNFLKIDSDYGGPCRSSEKPAFRPFWPLIKIYRNLLMLEPFWPKLQTV